MQNSEHRVEKIPPKAGGYWNKEVESPSGEKRKGNRGSEAWEAEAGGKIYILNIPLIKVINDAFYVKTVQWFNKNVTYCIYFNFPINVHFPL